MATTSLASPSRSNPFAKSQRALLGSSVDLPEVGSFSKSELLPSPRKGQPGQTSGLSAPHTVNGKALPGSGGSARRTGSTKWRLLWRGGLELGDEGYKLDGITFAAQLQFGGIPNTPTSNPFANTPARPLSNNITASPFTALPNAETDLCLSLESMRGRKMLKVRGVVDLPPEEELDGVDDSMGVHVYIAPHAPLLVSWFTNQLCRDGQLTESGRTKSAVAVGLGDEGVNNSLSSTVLIYGQLNPVEPRMGDLNQTAKQLTLMGARRKPPPAPTKHITRPGDPLPRAPLFPTRQPKKPPPPFPRRSASSASASAFPRARSHSAIYQPPPSLNTLPVQTDAAAGPAPKKTTPGRRGEKRKKPVDTQEAEVAEKRKRTGKIVVERSADETPKKPILSRDDSREDIFGTKPSADGDASGAVDGLEGSAKAKRTRITPTETRNKASIKKRLLHCIEMRGMHREHIAFKELFATTNKGTSFAFRSRISSEELATPDIERIVNIHLDMYWPDADAGLDIDGNAMLTTAGAVDSILSPVFAERYQGRAQDVVVKVEQESFVGSVQVNEDEDEEAEMESTAMS